MQKREWENCSSLGIERAWCGNSLRPVKSCMYALGEVPPAGYSNGLVDVSNRYRLVGNYFLFGDVCGMEYSSLWDIFFIIFMYMP